jgi:hypothetical protein
MNFRGLRFHLGETLAKVDYFARLTCRGKGRTPSRGYNPLMKLRGKNLVRVLWLVNLSFLLAGLLPNALGHPFFYPSAIRSYIQWGGLLLYVLSAFFIIAFARRLRGPASK